MEPTSLNAPLAALGGAMLTWSTLLQTVQLLYFAYLRSIGVSEGDADLIAHQADERAMISVLVPGIYRYAVDTPEFPHIVETLNAISNDLRNRRNRIIHDAWTTASNDLLRSAIKPIQLVKLQARRIGLSQPQESLATKDLQEFSK